ncbi:YciI family protein [Sodalis sp. dw_96]|uniref:YciI family protein n=1 Tax=Sodalis sp. dw_96 TaxID=2719794 RepID=UPI001BD652CB|nr:YciI family protein [Sodalis sp. dw_96]
MAFFIVTMTHPDGDGWKKHLHEHIDYLQKLVQQGVLRASGPVKNSPLRSGFLIFKAASRKEVELLIEKDPFSLARLIVSLSISEWDPLFGEFAAESSGVQPG